MQPPGNFQGLRQAFDPAIALLLWLTGGPAAVPAQARRANSRPPPCGPEVVKGQAITGESEVISEAAFSFTEADTGRPGVLMRLKSGDLAVYLVVCTHQACTVAYRPEEKKLACPCHGSAFDPARGAAVENGPANSPLPEVEIEVREGEVFLA